MKSAKNWLQRQKKGNEMSLKKRLLTRRSPGEPYRIVKERLSGTNADLTSFLFHYGGNVYAFSYEKRGRRQHTLIDAGDSRYRNQMPSILAENEVNPANIERIVITHHHGDHCGLAGALAKESEAKVLLHSNFRSFVEEEVSQEQHRWLGGFDPSELKECDIEYLVPSDTKGVVNIGGVGFPSLVEPIGIGEARRLFILACPESTLTHSPSQLIVLYSSGSHLHTYEGTHDGSRPTDDMLFSGDLWLMRGPLFDRRMGNLSRRFRRGFYQIKHSVSGKGTRWRDPREQDTKAKEALKRGFCLIRVKPGHGEEFIGSRIIPNSLLAERDLLTELGYSHADKSILRSRGLASKIANIMEHAYTSFVQEILFWKELGYSLDEIYELLVRIYKEQGGGGPLVEQDRKQRREKLKTTLARLRNDEAESDELHQLAESTLSELEGIDH